MSDDALHDELVAMGGEHPWPPTPDLAGAVARRIAPRRRSAALWRPAVALPALLAALVACVAIVPPARTAVLELLGVAGGEKVVRVPAAPSARPIAARDRGRALTLAEARAAVAFPVRVPRALGPPREVRLSGDLPGGSVSLLYGERAVLTVFAGRSLPYARKSVGPRTKVVTATVAGRPAIFLTGAPFTWVALGRDGRPVQTTARLINANVLLFDVGGLGYRLESGAGLARLLTIARSLLP